MKRFLVGFFAIVFCFSCGSRDTNTLNLASTEGVPIDSFPGECPYLTKDTEGNAVLSWVRMLNDSTTAFCYATLKEGKIFGDPTVIPGTDNIQPHGENLPKIIFKPSGEIIALWGAANPNPANKYSGLIFYVQSFDAGKTWTSPKPLVNSTASYDQRYYDVAILPGGEAGIIWLDNRKTTTLEGSGMHFAVTEGSNGFVNERLISQPCCQCCRTDLFVDSKGSIHVLYRGIIRDSIRDMVHIVSIDRGKSFSAPKRISEDNWVINGCPHTGPAMTETKDGLQFAWFTGGQEEGCYYTSSNDNGASFSPRSIISESGSHPQLTALSNNDVIVVWDESVQKGNKYFKRIGVQKREYKGVVSGKKFITPDTLTCAYPVITTTGEQGFIIAYTVEKQNKNYVVYQKTNAPK